MRKRPPTRPGFTIVELLVVLAVIAILMGLIVAGLRSAMATGRKTRENSNIRQLYVAWNAYSSQWGGALLPGFLDEATQQTWGVTYKNHQNGTVPAQLAQTYPWRLMPYLDFNYEVLLGYRGAETEDVDNDPATDWQPQPTTLPTWMQPVFGTAGSAAALQPAFGYNAYYMGGWYTSVNGVSAPMFTDSTWTNTNGSTSSGRLVAMSEANIGRPSETLIFCSSTLRPVGKYKATAADEDHAIGSAWVVPPYLAQTQIWGLGTGSLQGISVAGGGSSQADVGTLEVFSDESVPLRRYNRQASVVNADGSTGSAGAGELMNMQRWLGAAWKPDFRHNP